MNKSLDIGTESVDSKDEGMDTYCEGGKYLVVLKHEREIGIDIEAIG